MSLKITTGPRRTAVRAVLYGVEGVGKSSLAAMLPKPLFLDLEEGTHQLDVARAPIETFAALQSSIALLSADPQGFETIVIDSADWAERMASETLLKRQGKKSIEDFGFGKGFVMLAEEMSRTLESCDVLIRKGVSVVWIAHSKIVRLSPPDQTDGFDRYELKMSKQVSPLFKEWADLLLFANYQLTIVEGTDGRVKAQGGKDRVLHAVRSAAWDAKNRYGLPDTLPMLPGVLAPEIAAVFAGLVVAKPVVAEAPLVGTGAAAVVAEVAAEQPAPKAINAEQLAKLATYAPIGVCGPIIRKALDHYKELSIDLLTEDQAAKVIERCQEEMNKVAETPPTPVTPAKAAPGSFLFPKKEAAWLAANEPAVNAYLISVKWIEPTQTFRDMSHERGEKLVLKPDAFARAAKIQPLNAAPAAAA